MIIACLNSVFEGILICIAVVTIVGFISSLLREIVSIVGPLKRTDEE